MPKDNLLGQKESESFPCQDCVFAASSDADASRQGSKRKKQMFRLHQSWLGDKDKNKAGNGAILERSQQGIPLIQPRD